MSEQTNQHFETFDLSIENNIAHICLNRPEKRNSMIPSFWEDLPQVLRDIDSNSRARAIVISSSGPVFTAGMDLNAFAPQGNLSTEEAKRERSRHGAAFYDTARSLYRKLNTSTKKPERSNRELELRKALAEAVSRREAELLAEV